MILPLCQLYLRRFIPWPLNIILWINKCHLEMCRSFNDYIFCILLDVYNVWYFVFVPTYDIHTVLELKQNCKIIFLFADLPSVIVPRYASLLSVSLRQDFVVSQCTLLYYYPQVGPPTCRDGSLVEIDDTEKGKQKVGRVKDIENRGIVLTDHYRVLGKRTQITHGNTR